MLRMLASLYPQSPGGNGPALPSPDHCVSYSNSQTSRCAANPHDFSMRDVLNEPVSHSCNSTLSSFLIQDYPQFIPQQLRQPTPIPQINPFPPFPSFYIIIPLRPRHRRTQPYLSIGRLFVEHIRTLRRTYKSEDTSLRSSY